MTLITFDLIYEYHITYQNHNIHFVPPLVPPLCSEISKILKSDSTLHSKTCFQTAETEFLIQWKAHTMLKRSKSDPQLINLVQLF